MAMQKQKFEILQEKHPDMMVLQMQGNFYKAFNDSAYVLSGLMDYKLRTTKSGYKCGFPVIAYDKVKAACEEQKISYVVYEGDKLVDQGNFLENRFQEYCLMYGPDDETDETVKKNNTIKSGQALILVEGFGMNVTEAFGNLKENIEKEILSKGFRIVSLSVIEKDANSKVVFIQGIAVYE